MRAYADNAYDGTLIFGPYAYTTLNVGGESGFTNNPAIDCGTPGPVSTCLGLLNGSDVLANSVGGVASGSVIGKSPLLCWSPTDMDPATGAGHNVPSVGYWVTIARDSHFTTLVESAYTSEPCWAPKKPLVDEGTSYYWQVVPVGALGAANWQNPAGITGGFKVSPTFQHSSVPPTLVAPVGGASVSGSVVFRWTPVPQQEKNYTIEVAQDDSFSTILESATTDSTSYSATTTYPVGATVFWRVRANNDDDKGLAWSATQSFVQTLPVPTITTTEAFSG